MMLRNSSTHYGAIVRLFHWGMAGLIIVGLVGVETHDWFPKGSDLRNILMDTHFQCELLVFVLIWFRLGAVFSDRTPPIRPLPPVWQDMIAKLVHLALYAGMIVLPILGVVMQQAADHTVSLLGTQLPTFVGVNKPLAKSLREIHSLIGNVVIGLIVLHAVAAVWHHHKQHDNTLLRMLPPRRGL